MRYPYPEWPYTNGPLPFDPRDAYETWRGMPRQDTPSPFNPGGGMYRGAALPADALTPREREIVEITTRSMCGGGSRDVFRGADTPLSPEAFGSGAATGAQPAARLGSLSTLITTELLTCARGLTEVAADLREADTPDARQKALLNANSRFYYALGLLCSQGVVLSPDMPGRGAEVETRASDGCERLGREIDRLMGWRSGPAETAGRIADAAKACWRGLLTYDVENGEREIERDALNDSVTGADTRGVRRATIARR